MNNKMFFVANNVVVPVESEYFTMKELTSMDQYFAAKHIDKVNKSLKFYSDYNLLGDYKYKPKDVHVYPNGGIHAPPRFLLNSDV